jgi:hypothetical protein
MFSVDGADMMCIINPSRQRQPHTKETKMKTMYQVTSKLPGCGIYGTYETLEEARRQCGEDQFIEEIRVPR